MKKIIPFLCTLILFSFPCLKASAGIKPDMFAPAETQEVTEKTESTMENTGEITQEITEETKKETAEQDFFRKSEQVQTESSTAGSIIYFVLGILCGTAVTFLITVIIKKSSSVPQNNSDNSEELLKMLKSSSSKLKECSERIKSIDEIQEDPRRILNIIRNS